MKLRCEFEVSNNGGTFLEYFNGSNWKQEVRTWVKGLNEKGNLKMYKIVNGLISGEPTILSV
jgi:hypothetical protein